jgi:hypothetical protein
MSTKANSTVGSALLFGLLLSLGGCGGPGDEGLGGDRANDVSSGAEAEGSSGVTPIGSALSAETNASPEAAALTRAAQAEITVEAIDVELDSIVQYDRLSGDPGEIAAVNYLVRTLEAEGIQVRVDTFLAFISDPLSASVEVRGTDFAPEAITVSGSGDVQDLRRPLVDLGTLSDLPPFLTGTGRGSCWTPTGLQDPRIGKTIRTFRATLHL